METRLFEAACTHLRSQYKLVAMGITVTTVLLVTVYINLVTKIDIVYTHLFYIPITLAAIFYHRKAVYLALFLGLFHVAVNYYLSGVFLGEAILRTVMFIIVAYIIGSIVESKDQLCDVLKSSEERLRGMYETLELRIKERTAELDRANEGLRKEVADRQKAEEELRRSNAQAELYVDIMSHDIGNMNQAIMGYLEMAAETGHIGRDEREYLARSIDLVKNSSRLIDNVKKLQRINAGPLPAEKVDLGALLAQVAGKYSGSGDREITVRCPSVDRCVVMANSLIKDVFTNIIDNAIKHSRGPLTVDIRVERVRADSRECCRTVIEDNGPGLPDEMKKKLSRRPDSSELKAERRGLGLYLVQTLVGLYGGSMRIEDRIAGDYTQGTRLIVLLPACGSPDNGPGPS